jgi:alkylated DNA repair dioxygenase AlkB
MNKEWIDLEIPDARVLFMSEFLGFEESDVYFHKIMNETPWRQDQIEIYGKIHDLPRLQQWYGDKGLSYTWSGILMKPLEWTPSLYEIKEMVEYHCGCSFNTVLLNRYRDGNDTVGWHSDDEKELGKNPNIASVSFGASRDFQLRHKTNKNIKASVELTHGSLILMGENSQTHYQHQLPRRKKVNQERINLTFRQVR